MKAKTLFPIVLLTVIFTASGSFAAGKKTDADLPAKEAPPIQEAVKEKSATPSEATKKKELDIGMDGEAIIKQLGKPAEVNPIKSEEADVKAERWIYRRKLTESVIQSADGMSSMPAMTNAANPGEMVNIPVVSYRLKNVTVYQVTALLMVNGKLTHAKQWKEKNESYVN